MLVFFLVHKQRLVGTDPLIYCQIFVLFCWKLWDNTNVSEPPKGPQNLIANRYLPHFLLRSLAQLGQSASFRTAGGLNLPAAVVKTPLLGTGRAHQ